MSGGKVTLPDGKEYSFGEVGFSSEAVEVIELMEEAEDVKERSEAAKAAGQPAVLFKKNGRLMRLIRSLMLESMVKGGHSTEDADAGIRSLPMGADMSPYLAQICEAMGVN